MAQGDILPVSNGQISITVTAEDGTTSVDYTITLSAAFQVASIPKSNDDTQRRFHYVLFNISSLDSANDGRYKLALKAQGTAAPTVQEITDGVGVWRRLKAQTKRVMLSYTIDSNIKTFTESNLGKTRLHGGGVEGASDGSTYNIDSMFLRPGLSYTLYAFKEGGSSVLALEDFSTDVFDANATWPIPQDTFHDTVFSGEFTYSADDPVFIFPIAFLGYNITYDVTGSNKISVFRLAFHTGKLTLSVGKKETFLVPSEGTDGTRYLSLDSRDIALGYLALPKSWLGTGQSLTLAAYSNLAEITLVEDQ